MRTQLSTFVLSAITFAALVVPAAAQNYARQSCQQLWAERNQIYKDAGYCFKTNRAIRYFGNAGCQFDRQSDVPLSRDDRRVVDEIVRVESYKGCSD